MSQNQLRKMLRDHPERASNHKGTGRAIFCTFEATSTYFIQSFLKKIIQSLKEVSQNLATSMFLPGFFVVHDAHGGGENDEPELAGGEKVGGPLLQLGELDVVARADHAALVDASGELRDDLARTAVINHLELAEVTVLLHHLKEADDHLGGGSDQHLALASSLRIHDGGEGIVQNAHAHHFMAATR